MASVHVPFIAGAGSGPLDISSATQFGGDGSLALDNIQVFQINSDYVNIFNASFESGVSYAFPGYQAAVGDQALKAGKHVHLDKPGALRHDEFKAMRIEALRRRTHRVRRRHPRGTAATVECRA